jgi:retron-type reverse transcriptase
VTSTRSRGRPGTAVASPPAFHVPVHVADFLLPISLLLWAVGLSRTNATDLGPLGLTANLSVLFYAGVALLVVSAVFELAQSAPSKWRMSLHAVGLVVMLYGTAPLIYPEGRYSWLYKTIGVVQYINVHGALNHNIDIYQNWPGFFALAAWFGHVAGAGDPVTYAKWSQLVFELAALPLLYLVYDALSLTVRQRWLAILLYAGSNWIGQDYYSPQGVGTLLSLGIMAIVMRWMFQGNLGQGAPRRRGLLPRRRAAKQKAQGKTEGISRQEVLEAFHSVKSQDRPPGVDGVTVADFEHDLAHNLQKIWGQMCSGVYFPAPVRAFRVTREGRTTTRGAPTISDMVAQTVIARRLEARAAQLQRAREAGRPRLPARSDTDSWTIELTLRTVFSTCRHDLMLKVVEATADQRWITQYVRRCLKVPLQEPGGALEARGRGLPPGSPLGPVLAELFLQHVLDMWMRRTFPEIGLDRHLTTVLVHCRSEREARVVCAAMAQRFTDVGLRVRPERVRIVHRQAGEPDRYLDPGRDLGVAKFPPSPQVAGRVRDERRPEPLVARSGSVAGFCAAIMLIFFVLSFIHELSPYILIVQLGVLAGGRMLRPRWLPAALLAIAIGYLLPRLPYVNSHYGLLSSIGNFFSNVAPPSSSVGGTFLPVPQDQILIQRGAELLSVLMWLLAIAGAWRRRRSRRTMLALVVLTFSPALVLVAQAYGNEGVLRVYLFSLPWAAALAASALEPVGGLGARMLSRLSVGSAARPLARIRTALSWIKVPVILGLVIALFFLAFFGDDAFDVMPKSEVQTLLAFQEHARLGPIYCATGNEPLLNTAKYPELNIQTVFGNLSGTPVVTTATPDIALVLARNSRLFTEGGALPAYVVIAPSMIAYNRTYNQVPASYFTILRTSLAHSKLWKLIANDGQGTVIYELRPGTDIPAATATKKPVTGRKATPRKPAKTHGKTGATGTGTGTGTPPAG